MISRLETERLILRPFAAADAEAVQGYCSLWEIAGMTTRIAHPYPKGAAAAWIAGHATASDAGEEHVFCITSKDGGDRPIGAAGLHETGKDNLELGYWLAPEYWGHGLATEAAKAMVVLGFEKLQAEALNSGHFTDNPASGRVLEKAGFRANGIARQWSEARQDFVTCERLLLTRETWQAARGAAGDAAP